MDSAPHPTILHTPCISHTGSRLFLLSKIEGHHPTPASHQVLQGVHCGKPYAAEPTDAARRMAWAAASFGEQPPSAMILLNSLRTTVSKIALAEGVRPLLDRSIV